MEDLIRRIRMVLGDGPSDVDIMAVVDMVKAYKGQVIAPPRYPEEFNLVWEGTAKTGTKAKAYRAWLAVGCPLATAIAPAWKAWEAHWNGFGVEHVSTWLRAYNWQETPAPRAKPAPVRTEPPPVMPSAAYQPVPEMSKDYKEKIRKSWGQS